MTPSEKKWWQKLMSPSSPDAFRQDRKEEVRKREVEKTTKEELSKIRQENLKQEVEKQSSSSRPEKDKAVIASADERAGDAKEFLEKENTREEERKNALAQGGPEEQSEDKG